MKWFLSQREEIEQAEGCGFTAEEDRYRGKGWCKFSKGDIRVWKAKDWVRATFDGTHFRHHTRHKTLLEALMGHNGEKFGPDAHKPVDAES